MRSLYNRKRQLLVWVTLACTVIATTLYPVSALANGYATDDTGLIAGMVVALSESSTPAEPKVERAALDKEAKVIGVSTTADSQLITVGSSKSKVFVQTTGEATVFVASLNGDVKKGDLLAPSPLLGILMKADESTAPIVGIAIEDFDENAAETQTIQEAGVSKETKIDQIRINLDHKAASNQQSSATDSSLERLGRAIVGKDVGEIQVLAALVIFLIVLVAEGGIIYGAISSAITALGRNPMAHQVIRKEMVRVVGIAIIVLGIGIAAIYAILWI
ncbi:MAG TPA: hypothetical protein VK674_02295 [Candidatus Limnocylindria bacterium]|nr:hypothetical protein [Candidatus Limnocylindria bacterium]